MNKNVHSSPIHNSQTSTIKGGDKFIVVQPHNGILYCRKEQATEPTCVNFSYLKLSGGKKKKIPEKHRQYNLFSTKFKNKHLNNILLRHTYILNKT